MYKTYSIKEIKNTAVKKGFVFESVTFSIEGDYLSKDSLWNHQDVPHYNYLHANLAGGYGNETMHYGDVVSFIRYYKLFNIISVPIVTLLFKEDKNILEVFNFMNFIFFKINTETDLENGKCLSKVKYEYGTDNKLLMFLFKNYFKKRFSKSFDDFIKDDHPFLNERGKLRKKGYILNNDEEEYTFSDTYNLQNQNILLDAKIEINKNEISLELSKLKNNDVHFIGENDAFGLQISKNNNNICIYPRLCPHDGGNLDSGKCHGNPLTIEQCLKKKQVRCNVHNRLFNPLIEFALENDYFKKTELFEFKYDSLNSYLYVKYEHNINNRIDWTK